MSVTFGGSPDSRVLSSSVKRRFRRYVFWSAWIIIAAPIPVFLAGVDPSLAVRVAPLLVSAVFLGMPHGAVDHLALPRVQESWSTRDAVRTVVVLYALLGSAYTLWWFVHPVSAAVFFILLTWFHWGQGDLFPLMAFTDADHFAAPAQRALTVVVRGGIPMLVPLLAFPDVYRRVLEVLVVPFAGPGYEGVPWLFEPRTRLVLGAVFGGLTVATLAVGYRGSRNRRAWATDAFEVALLWVFFVSVPPVFAIGLYFCVWHSARHVARLITIDDPAMVAVRRRNVTSALWRFARDATPTTIVSVALFAGLFLLVPDPPDSLLSHAGLYLVLIAVLTFPHVVIVSAMDRYQDIW
jgi:Brp/Blh family beta-carotene 15,15'-monooxygenase